MASVRDATLNVLEHRTLSDLKGGRERIKK
jgi:hypothetical protein